MTDVSDEGGEPAVHVIDDDDGLRQAVINLLHSAGLQTRDYPSPDAFLSAWRPSYSGCLLLDIRFPEANGLDIQAGFGASGVLMPVILMTGHGDVPSSIRGMKAGAIDFLVKPFDDDALFEAIAIAMARDAVRTAAEIDISGVQHRFASLTPREREVLALVCTGLMNKQVAGELGLSEITVKVHRGTMMRKMNLKTVADLVRAFEALKAAGSTGL